VCFVKLVISELHHLLICSDELIAGAGRRIKQYFLGFTDYIAVLMVSLCTTLETVYMVCTISGL